MAFAVFRYFPEPVFAELITFDEGRGAPKIAVALLPKTTLYFAILKGRTYDRPRSRTCVLEPPSGDTFAMPSNRRPQNGRPTS